MTRPIRSTLIPIPSDVHGHPVVAAFRRMDDEGWIVVYHEATRPGAPFDYEDPDGFVVAAFRPVSATAVDGVVLARDLAFVPATTRAAEAAYLNQG